MELGVELISLDPSSKILRFVMSPGGRLPGPEGEGRCLIGPIPGDGARRGGVALPKPESVSPYRYAMLSWSLLDPNITKRTHLIHTVHSNVEVSCQ